MRHDALGVAAIYVGAVVGGGFATGREVLFFFAAYGRVGLLGCLAAGAAFAWLGARVLRLAATGSVRDYTDLYRLAVGPALAVPADWATSAFLYVGLAVVLAGGAALGAETWGLAPWVGAAAVAAGVALIALPGRPGLLWGNLALVPAMVAGAVVLLAAEAGRPTFWTAIAAAGHLPGRLPATWPLGAALYVGYNLLLGAVALCAAGAGMPPRAAVWGGAAGGGVLGALAGVLALPILAHLPAVAAVPVPLGRIVEPYGPAWRAAYALELAAALITTGVATAYALALRLAPGRAATGLVAAAAVLLAMPAAAFGRVTLVATVYPAMGLLGCALCAGLTLRRPPKD
jgi:uncharacterized membrane protein YkvI